jgi:hypothetical protein
MYPLNSVPHVPPHILSRKKEARHFLAGCFQLGESRRYSKWVEFPLRLIRCIGKPVGGLHADSIQNRTYQKSTRPVGAR